MATSWNASLSSFPYTSAFTSDWKTQPIQVFVYKLALSPGSYEISVLPDLIVLTTATGGVTAGDISYFAEEPLISWAYITRNVDWWDSKGQYHPGESRVASLQHGTDTLAIQALQDAGITPSSGMFGYYTTTVNIEPEKIITYQSGSKDVYTDDYYLYIAGWSQSYPHYPDFVEAPLSGRFLITLGNPTGQRTQAWGGEWLNILSFFDYYALPLPPPSTDLDPTKLPTSINFLPTDSGHAVESPPIQTNIDPAWWSDTGKSVFLGYVSTALDALKGVAEAAGNFKLGAALDVVNSAASAASVHDLLKGFINKLLTHAAEGMTRAAQASASVSAGAYDWVPGWEAGCENIVKDYDQQAKDYTVSDILDKLLPGTLSGTVWGTFRSIPYGASEKNSFSLDLHVPGLPAQGGDKSDVLFGGNGDDTMQLGAGTDFGLGLEGNDIISAADGNDWLRGGKGNDTLDGGSGTDTATYSGIGADYTLAKTGNSYTVKDNLGTDGTDTVTSVERLQFSNTKLALDLGVAQPGGEAALLIGAVVGKASLTDKALVGQFITFFDAGYTMHDAANVLVNAGIMDRLAGGSSTNAYVSLIYYAVVGQVATPATTAELAGYIESGGYTKADFLSIVASLPLNQANVDLVGLQLTGLSYT